MDLHSGVGPSREIQADGNPEHSFTSFSGPVVESQRKLANDFYIAAKYPLFDHFKEMITEEITKLLCPQYGGSVSQELADVTEPIGAQGSPCSAEMSMDRTPPHFSQMAVDEPPIPAGMATDRTPGPSEKGPDETSRPAGIKNNSPCLALMWQNESHATIIKLADDPSKQMRNFASGNHNGCFGTCYIASVKSIQETSKSEIPDGVNVSSDFNKQQGCEPPSSSDAPRESRPYNLKRKRLIDQASPTNAGAFPTGLLKKKRRGDVSSQKAKPSLIMDVVTRVKYLSDVVDLKSQQDSKLVSSGDSLHNDKEKRLVPCTCGSAKKRLIPCTRGSARTSIDGWEWLRWSHKATNEQKRRVRGWTWNDVKKSPHIDARASRAKLRNMVGITGSKYAQCLQMKGQTIQLRFTRSKIHGWGVVAYERISSKEFIVEYVGEVIRNPILDIRGLRYEKDGICDYFFKIDANYVGRTKQLRFTRSKIHGCGVVVYERISSKVFIVEYVGEVIRNPTYADFDMRRMVSVTISSRLMQIMWVGQNNCALQGVRFMGAVLWLMSVCVQKCSLWNMLGK